MALSIRRTCGATSTTVGTANAHPVLEGTGELLPSRLRQDEVEEG